MSQKNNGQSSEKKTSATNMSTQNSGQEALQQGEERKPAPSAAEAGTYVDDDDDDDGGGEDDHDLLFHQDERTKRLVAVLPEEKGLWKYMYYFPSPSPRWDEHAEKRRAVAETEAALRTAFTAEYVRNEIQQLEQSSGFLRPGITTSTTTAPVPNNRRGHGPPKKKKKKRQRRSYQDADDPNDIDEEYQNLAYDDVEMQADPHNLTQSVAQQSLRDPAATREKLTQQATELLQSYIRFLHALPECEPLTAGFSLIPVFSDQRCCFCACSARLEAWRKETVWNRATGGPPPFFASCGNSKQATTLFSPAGLVRHVSEWKGDGSGRNWWHWIIHEYLQRVFQHFRGPDSCHMAFLPKGRRLRNALRKEHGRVGSYLRNLGETQEIQKRKMAELLQQTSQLETTCQHLSKRLDQQLRSEEALRKLLAVSYDESYVSSDSIGSNDMEKYRKARERGFATIRRSIPIKKVKKESSAGIHVTIPQQNNDDKAPLLPLIISEGNKKLFLGDLPTARDAAHWFLPMNVKYEAAAGDTSAIDRGGPTRQFISDVFQGLDRLRVKCHATGKETNLWTRDETGFFFPEQDDTILHKLGLTGDDRTEALEAARVVIKPWARAVGRLIFYCMANVIHKDDEYQKTDQPLYVDENVLPEIYIYHLIADIQPTSSNGAYPMKDLVNLLSKHRIMKGQDWNWAKESDQQKAEKGLHDYISAHQEDEDHHDNDVGVLGMKHKLRKAAQYDFIESRQIVLSGMAEGISLDAELDFDARLAWGRAPVSAIREMLCSMPSCSVENVIKYLKPEYTNDYPEFVATQKKLLRTTETGKPLGLLPDVLKAMCENDPQVAGMFVFFATGMRYTPYKDDTFRIKIEFTFTAAHGEVTDDMLPWAHSCPRDVLFPGFAYHGNAEVLRKKLSQVIEYAGFFTME